MLYCNCKKEEEDFCDELENTLCEPVSYVWSWLFEEWQCSKCSWGLHRIYDSRNTLQHWMVEE